MDFEYYPDHYFSDMNLWEEQQVYMDSLAEGV